jgi:[acyl-carrier-protein] S-malonyltransferase
MLEPFRHAREFTTHYALVCELLGFDPVAEQDQPDSINRNAVSSLLTVLAGVLALTLLRETSPEFKPVALAGYSVGQWTALHAAGAISAEELLRVVYKRACLMDARIRTAEPSGMLAVIGLRSADILAICEDAGRLGLPLQITNDNAPGQATLGGTLRSLEFAEERLSPLRPKKLQRVPTAGAWHSTILSSVVPQLQEFLERVALAPPQIPVIDNTTGDWLPRQEGPMRAALARHVASPVLWQQGIRTMVASGAKHFLEAGYGDMLTKFGFFIDRSVQHVATAATPRRP